jgi:glycosyl transferase family 87
MSRTARRPTTDDRRRTTDDRQTASSWLVVGGRWSVVSGWRAEALLAILVALLAVVLAAIGFSQARPPTLDLGVRDSRFIAGFHEPESFGGATVRWTTSAAEIALPRLSDRSAAVLSLWMLNSRPADRPDPQLELGYAGRRLAAFDVPRTVNSMRVYRALVPGNLRLDWAARFALRGDTIVLPDDPRPLGVVVDRAALTPLGTMMFPPPLWQILWSAALGALGYALPRSAGLRRGLACALAVTIAALVAGGVAARPMEVLPFVHRVVALLALGCLGIWIARLLAPPFPATDDRPTDERSKIEDRPSILRPPSSILTRQWSMVGGQWSLRGSDLPVYLAVGWWMAPLFEIIMTADGARNVRPPLTTIWIGGAFALLLLLVAGGWYLLRGRALPREQRASGVARAALAICAVAGLAHLAYMIWFAFQRQGPDFWILFKGARDWARGGSLYDLDAIVTNHFGHVFKVPPFYGMLFVPFVSLDGERVLFFHRVLNTILLGTTALAWFRMWGLRLMSPATAGMLVLLNFRPLTDTIAFGQIDLALLLTLALALWALRKDHDILAGALVALGVLFKIYPVILLAFFVVKRRWWGLVGFALGMVAYNGLAIVVMGWEMHRVYMTAVLPNIGGTTAWVENQTVSGFLARLVESPASVSIFRDRTIVLAGMGISGLIALLACGLALRPCRSSSPTFALQYSQFPLLMVLVVPAAWVHYETLLFIPFAALLLYAHDRPIRLARAACLALSFALIGYGNQWSFYDGTVMGALTIAGVSYKFYGMLLLGGVLASTLLGDLAVASLWRTRGLALFQRWRVLDRSPSA